MSTVGASHGMWGQPLWPAASPPAGNNPSLGGVNVGNYAKGNGLSSTVTGMPEFSMPPTLAFEGLLGKFSGAEAWQSLM
jgi:hypothetical protein